MAQTKILLDSTSYFRLAQDVHPLLFQTFGEKNYTLYVHGDLMREFQRSSRLQNKFHWVNDPEYVENRKRSLQFSAANKMGIEQTFEYMWEWVKEEGLGPSKVDVKILATASEVGLTVVTDDQDMIDFADMYGIGTMRTIELLKLMVDESHIEMEKVRAVVAHWNYENDLPFRGFAVSYRKLFGEAFPTGEV